MNRNLGAYLTAKNLTNMKGSPETYPFLWNWHGMSGFLTTQGLSRAERVSGLGQEGDAPGDTGAPNSPDDVGAAVNEANKDQLTTTVDDVTDAVIETTVAVTQGAQNFLDNQVADGLVPSQEPPVATTQVVPSTKETPWLLYGGIAAAVFIVFPMLKKGIRK